MKDKKLNYFTFGKICNINAIVIFYLPKQETSSFKFLIT